MAAFIISLCVIIVNIVIGELPGSDGSLSTSPLCVHGPDASSNLRKPEAAAPHHEAVGSRPRHSGCRVAFHLNPLPPVRVQRQGRSRIGELRRCRRNIFSGLFPPIFILRQTHSSRFCYLSARIN